MKKISLFLLLVFIAIQSSFGQVNWSKYSQSFSNETISNGSKISSVALIPMEDDQFWTLREPSEFKMLLKKDPSFIKERQGDFVAITTFDTAKAQFFIQGVNRKNAGEYELRVLQDSDKVIVPWSSIQRFSDAALQHQSGMLEMAYAGEYKATFGHKIIVDLRNKKNDRIISSAVVKWISIKPSVVEIYTASEFNEFMARLNHPWTIKGSVNRHPGKLVLPSSDNNLVFYLRSNVYEKKLIEYEVIKDDEVYTNWKQNDFDNSFIWLKDLSPGSYYLKIRYSVQRNHITTYPFEIEKAWYQSNAFRIMAGILTAAFLAL